MPKTTVINTEWTLVASGSVAPNGSLYLQEGQECSLCQATELPTTDIKETPLLDRMRYREIKVYFDLDTDENIYGRTEYNDCEISDTPAKKSAS